MSPTTAQVLSGRDSVSSVTWGVAQPDALVAGSSTHANDNCQKPKQLTDTYMQEARKAIPLNTARQLWSECGGYCQNPTCRKPLFLASRDRTTTISIANVAHIIGWGNNGPRSEHDLAQQIERDGLDNLIMLCLECHKLVDELERLYPVAAMQQWKRDHLAQIAALFETPTIRDEQKLLQEVNDLLDINGAVFREYGPYSQNVVNGEGGDGLQLWRQRCLDTLIPNNERIIALIHNNRRNFGYPWDVYQKLIGYKMHADAFRDNCLTNRKINDYKLFPLDFDHFVKTRLNIPVPPLEQREDEELTYRHEQIRTLIDRFLHGHEKIEAADELSKGAMLVKLVDGRELKVFVTYTYFFTEYSLDQVIAIDPAIDAIICALPAGGYGYGAKAACIEQGIGLFKLNEFMGAINTQGEDYLNYLLRSARESRLDQLWRIVEACDLQCKATVYAFGSYLRRMLHGDVDLVLVYSPTMRPDSVAVVEQTLAKAVRANSLVPDIIVASEAEFSELRLQLRHDNLTKVEPRERNRF